MDNDNKENVYVGDVCEVAAKKRKKDFFNNNTKSQCKYYIIFNCITLTLNYNNDLKFQSELEFLWRIGNYAV